MEKKSDEERLGAILSLRVPVKTRARLVREAAAMGKKLSDHLFDMLALGIETNQARLKAEKEAEAEVKRLESAPGQGTPANEELTEEPKGSKSSGSNNVDQAFLEGIKLKYPTLNHDRLLNRLNEISKSKGRLMTRNTVERLFKIASEKV